MPQLNDTDNSDKPQRSKEELKNALVVAEKNLSQLKSTKRSIVKQYNDDISDAQSEIDGIMEQLDGMD